MKNLKKPMISNNPVLVVQPNRLPGRVNSEARIRRTTVDASETENESQLNITSIQFIKCEMQVDTSETLNPRVVGVYFFEIQTPKDSFILQRRYSHFILLDNFVKLRFPQAYLPKLPPKQILHNGPEPNVVSRRSKELLFYLQRVIQIPNVFKYEIINEWFIQPPDSHMISFTKQRKAGYLFRESSIFHVWKKRYGVVSFNVLALFESAKDMLVYKCPSEVYCLKDTKARIARDKGTNVISISRNGINLEFIKMENDEETIKWLNCLQEAILSKQQSLQTLRSVYRKASKQIKHSKTQNLDEGGAIMKNPKRRILVIDSTVAAAYQSRIYGLFDHFIKEINSVYPYFQSSENEIDERDKEVIEQIKELNVDDIMGGRLEEYITTVLQLNKKYTQRLSIQRITWSFINMYKVYKTYCVDATHELQLLNDISISKQIYSKQTSSSKPIVCRICEQMYPLSSFVIHTKLCEIITKSCMKETTCITRIKRVMSLLKETYGYEMVSDSFHYTQLVELIPTFDDPIPVEKLKKVNEGIKTLCVDLTDINLLTFARAFMQLIDSTIILMNDYLDFDNSNKNLWNYLSLVGDKTINGVGVSYSDSVTVDSFEVIKKFSAGAYSRIYLVKKKSTGDVYAMKVMKKEDMIRKNVVDSVLLEREFLAQEHINSIVKLYYAFQDDVNLYLVMEYCPGGDLSTLLQNIGCLSEGVAKIYSAEILLSLYYIHKIGCIHRDIKPDNILIDKNGHLVLTDFGLSSYGLPSQEGNEGLFCTPDYAAPEILISNSYSYASDYFAFGCMIFEFITGVPPFNADSPEMIFNRIRDGKYDWGDADVSDECKDMVAQLLQSDPSRRPLFHDIKHHPFYKGIHWDKLFEEDRSDVFVPELDGESDTGYFADDRKMKELNMKKDDLLRSKSDSLNVSGIDTKRSRSLSRGKTIQLSNESTITISESYQPSKIIRIKRKSGKADYAVSSSPESQETFEGFNAKNIDNLVEENNKLYKKELDNLEADL